MQSYSFINLLILLLLSGLMCVCVYFCIFDLFFQLTLLKFISAMHSGTCYQISYSKNIYLIIGSINTRGLGDRFKIIQISSPLFLISCLTLNMRGDNCWWRL